MESKTPPSAFAEKMSELYLPHKKYSERSKIGQFFTPVSMTSRLVDSIVSLSSNSSKSIRIIDLGAGTGILSTTYVERLISNTNLKEIHLDLVELDSDVIQYLKLTMEYLSLWSECRGIQLRYNIIPLDIISNSPFSNLYNTLDKESYDCVLSNPPYFKIRKSIEISSYYKNIIHGQANAYAIFMSLGIDLIKKDGLAGFITPQSYFNGNSFLKLREKIFRDASLKSLIVSHGRHSQFINEKVSQKICISTFKKSEERDHIYFDYINQESTPLRLDYSKIVREGVIYIPLEDREHKILEEVLSYKARMGDFGLSVSTGSIVPHETPDLLSKDATQIPLIWLKHVRDGEVTWPLEGFSRSHYIVDNCSPKKLIKAGNYILLRRCAFSETRRHLYCSLFEGVSGYEVFSLENHVNYIYFLNDDLSKIEQQALLTKIYSYLISDHATAYFKSRCGNTQINVIDLLSLPLPDMTQ